MTFSILGISVVGYCIARVSLCPLFEGLAKRRKKLVEQEILRPHRESITSNLPDGVLFLGENNNAAAIWPPRVERSPRAMVRAEEK